MKKYTYILKKTCLLFLFAIMLSLCACKGVSSHSNKNGSIKKTKTKKIKAVKPLKDYYSYNNEDDRKRYDLSTIEVPVPDEFYMTQINDFFTNFQDYEGKTVSIEGYYMNFDGYKFVGRKGPTCPYCTGGYVNFEFQTDEDVSKLKHLSSWISVKGVLRKGESLFKGGKKSVFYYIEALEIKPIKKPKIDTVTK